MTLILLVAILLYEWTMYKPADWKETVSYILITVFSGLFVWRVPQSFALLCFMMYGFHHSFFLKRRKGVLLIICGYFCVSFYMRTLLSADSHDHFFSVVCIAGVYE